MSRWELFNVAGDCFTFSHEGHWIIAIFFVVVVVLFFLLVFASVAARRLCFFTAIVLSALFTADSLRLGSFLAIYVAFAPVTLALVIALSFWVFTFAGLFALLLELTVLSVG